MVRAIILFMIFVTIAAMMVLGLINLFNSNSMDSSDYTFAIVSCIVITAVITYQATWNYRAWVDSKNYE